MCSSRRLARARRQWLNRLTLDDSVFLTRRRRRHRRRDYDRYVPAHGAARRFVHLVDRDACSVIVDNAVAAVFSWSGDGVGYLFDAQRSWHVGGVGGVNNGKHLAGTHNVLIVARAHLKHFAKEERAHQCESEKSRGKREANHEEDANDEDDGRCNRRQTEHEEYEEKHSVRTTARCPVKHVASATLDIVVGGADLAREWLGRDSVVHRVEVTRGCNRQSTLQSAVDERSTKKEERKREPSEIQ